MEITLRPLVTVFVLTAIATTVAILFRPASERLSLALVLDLVPFVGVAVTTVIATVRLRRIPLPVIRLLISVYGYFAGALVGTLGVAHLVAVVIGAIDRGRQHSFVYGFHFYSVVLLGVLLIAAGLMAVIEAGRHSSREAWSMACLDVSLDSNPDDKSAARTASGLRCPFFGSCCSQIVTCC